MAGYFYLSSDSTLRIDQYILSNSSIKSNDFGTQNGISGIKEIYLSATILGL